MEVLVMHQGKLHASHHGFPLFPLAYPTLTSVFDPSNWTFDDDIDRVSDDEAAPSHGGEVGGASGGGDDASPSGVGPSGKGGSDILSSSGAIPLEEGGVHSSFDPEPHWGRLLGFRCYPFLSV